ncbi:regulatory protein RecX [Roseivivax sp. CAU 1761]
MPFTRLSFMICRFVTFLAIFRCLKSRQKELPVRFDHGTKGKTMREQSDAAELNQEWLREAALNYLKSYETTEGHLRAVLERKIFRRIMGTGREIAEFRDDVEEVVRYCAERRYVDDRRFVELFVENGRASGMSRKKIEMKLRLKKINPSDYDDILCEEPSVEVNAAVTFARKKRIGAFRTGEQDQYRQKDMAKLARQGFGFEICRRIVDGDLPDEN